jgi:hypothetical protein
MRLVMKTQRMIRVFALEAQRVGIVLSTTAGRHLDHLVAHLGTSSKRFWIHPNSRSCHTTNRSICDTWSCLSANPRPAYASIRRSLSTSRIGS